MFANLTHKNDTEPKNILALSLQSNAVFCAQQKLNALARKCRQNQKMASLKYHEDERLTESKIYNMQTC
jgi:hypothetical protein